LNNPNQDQTES